MDEHVQTYRTVVLEKFEKARQTTPDPRLLVETRLDFGNYIPDAFGTADAVIIADGMMEIIDFKYGKGVRVEAERNPQMMIYALGAYDEFSLEYDIKQVRMTIVQPRLQNISEYTMSVYDLMAWAENTLKPTAMKAYNGEGEQKPGDWCRFCKVRGKCKALAEDCLSTASRFSDPRLITPEMMAIEVLPRLASIKSWVTDVEEYALQRALDGEKFKGYKVVEGRSNRKITDAQGVLKVLSGEYDTEALMKPRELKIGKKRFAELCSGYITKPQGKPTLVPESDKRPPFNSAEDDFRGINL